MNVDGSRFPQPPQGCVVTEVHYLKCARCECYIAVYEGQPPDRTPSRGRTGCAQSTGGRRARVVTPASRLSTGKRSGTWPKGTYS
jgi:hypothetical protein